MSNQQVKIFVISQKSYKLRQAFMVSQMSKLGLSFEFVESTRKDLLTPEEVATLNPSGSLSKAEISCASAHRIAYQRILEENLKYALILEDDVILGSGIKTLLWKNDLEVKDFIYLSSHTFGRNLKGNNEQVFVDFSTRRTLTKGFDCAKLSIPPAGAWAYLISSDAAQRRLEETKVLAEPIDTWQYSAETYQFEAITNSRLCWLSLHSCESKIREHTINTRYGSFGKLKRYSAYLRFRRFLNGEDRQNRVVLKDLQGDGTLDKSGKWGLMPWGNNDILHHSDPLSQPELFNEDSD